MFNTFHGLTRAAGLTRSEAPLPLSTAEGLTRAAGSLPVRSTLHVRFGLQSYEEKFKVQSTNFKKYNLTQISTI